MEVELVTVLSGVGALILL